LTTSHSFIYLFSNNWCRCRGCCVTDHSGYIYHHFYQV
jgi:hypothetical protein